MNKLIKKVYIYASNEASVNDSIFTNVSKLSKESLDALTNITEEILLPKGHVLMRNDRVEHHLYFIKKGIVRAYSEGENQEVTFWFGAENDVIISMKSYIYQQVSYEKIELLEPCELYKIVVSDLQQLFETNLEISNWGRKLAEKELVKVEERFISRQCKSATERYQDLLKNQTHLLHRVQLGYIASYLGITQVSLSRIRAEIK